MKRILMVAALAGAVMLAGCSTPVTSSDAKPVPAERVFGYQAKPQGVDFGTVVITRDTGFVGGGVAVTVSIDGKQAAALRTGERVTLYVPAGEHILSDSQVANTRHDHELIVKAGQVKFYRISVDAASQSTLLTPTLPD